MPVAIHLGRRVGAAISVLLILCAILTTVSVLQANRLESNDADAAASTIDTVAPLRQMLRRIDQVRGLEALHLLVKSAAEQRALEAEIRAQRRAIDAALAQSRVAAGDGVDLALEAAARADFAAYWGLQARLLSLSRRALADPAAATEARQLFDRDSQAIVERLRDQLDRWWSHRERREREALQAQRADAAQALRLVALLGLLALAAGAVLARALSAPMAGPLPGPPPEGVKELGSGPSFLERQQQDPPPANGIAVVEGEAASASRVLEVQALIDAARGRTAAAREGAATPAARD
jgi:hypothetical protein